MWTGDGDTAPGRERTARPPGVPRRTRVLEPRPHLLHQHRRGPIEGDPDLAWPGVDRHAHFHRRPGHIRIRLVVSRGGAEGEQLDLLAVDRHLELMHPTQPARPAQLNENVVVGIERKMVADEHPAARAKRQPVGALVLLLVLCRPIGLGDSGRWRAAEREVADRPARRQIPLEQRLRHAEHAANVVEPEAGIVSRQEVIDVDLEREQIADGVAILRPVQTMQGRRPSRVGPGHPRVVELSLEPGLERVVRGVVRAGPPGGRHQARAQLPHDLLPLGGVVTDGRQVERVERQPDRPQLGNQCRSGLVRPFDQRLVVTADAVLIEQGSVFGGGRWLRAGGGVCQQHGRHQAARARPEETPDHRTLRPPRGASTRYTLHHADRRPDAWPWQGDLRDHSPTGGSPPRLATRSMPVTSRGGESLTERRAGQERDRCTSAATGRREKQGGQLMFIRIP